MLKRLRERPNTNFTGGLEKRRVRIGHDAIKAGYAKNIEPTGGKKKKRGSRI